MCHILKGKPPFARQIKSEEQDSLAHILALKQEESAPKTDSKPANLVPRTYVSPVPKSVLKERI